MRLARGVSQKRLGILAGIDEFSASSRINQYEKGKHVPDYMTATRLAKAMDIPVTYLFADDDELAFVILALDKAPRRKKAQIMKLLKDSKN